MRIIVTGSLAFDFIMDFPGKFSDHILPEKIHAINLSFLVNNMSRQRGGTAGNIAYNLALLSVKSSVFAVAGYDFDNYKKELEKAGADTSLIRTVAEEPTASAYIFTDKVDNQIAGFYPGAMNASSLLKLTDLNLKTDKSLVIISPNDPPAMIKLVKECRKLKISYLFDPGMQLPRLTDKDLKDGIEGAKIVIGNDYEIALINSRLQLKSSNMDKDKIWVTTLGEKGSTIEYEGKKYIIPPAKPEGVLDPTGAGDAWRAGFLAGFVRGLPLEICGRMGSIAAVYTVEKYGTQTHKFKLSDFKKRYRENFKQELKLDD